MRSYFGLIQAGMRQNGDQAGAAEHLLNGVNILLFQGDGLIRRLLIGLRSGIQQRVDGRGVLRGVLDPARPEQHPA